MQKGLTPDHFFETDATAQRRERQAAKAGNKNGNPIILKAKSLAAIQDPHSQSCLLVAESSGSVRRVDVETGDIKQTFRGPSAPVTCLAVGGANAQTLFAGSWDKDIWSWSLTPSAESKGPAPGRRFSGHSDFVKALVCARLGGRHILISGGADKKIMVWDAETGSRLHVLQDQTVSMMAVQHLAIDPVESKEDEIVLVSASSDPNIRRWRIRADGAEQIAEVTPTGEPKHAILEHETTVYKLLFDLEGEDVDLWTASGDGYAKCLSRHKGLSTEETLQHGDHVRAIALTDQWIITGGRDEDIKIWDRGSGSLYCTLEGHFDEITDLVSFRTASISGTYKLASVSLDGTIRTWPTDKASLDAVVQEQRKQSEGVEEESGVDMEAESHMTAEEEAELAALLEDDD